MQEVEGVQKVEGVLYLRRGVPCTSLVKKGFPLELQQIGVPR